MTIKALIDLANAKLPPRVLSEEEHREYIRRLAQFDAECLERLKSRQPTQQQLQRTCDYHIRNP